MAILVNVARSVDAVRTQQEVLLYETATALAGGGTFGTAAGGVGQADRSPAVENDFIERGHLRELVIYAKADVAGALPSLFVEESGDGSTVDHTAFTVIVLAGKAVLYLVAITAKYFRVRYTNGGGAQSTFVMRVTGRVPTPSLMDDALGSLHPAGTQEDHRPLYQYLKNGASIEMGVDGSGTVVTFEYTAPTGEHAYIERSMWTVQDTKLVIGGFFSLSALTNGLLIQIIDTDGTTVLEEFGSADAAFKKHIDLAVLSGLNDIRTDTVGNVGEFGKRWTLSKAGGAMHLAPGQIFRVTVRDNIAALDQFRVMLQGIVSRSTQPPPILGAQL